MATKVTTWSTWSGNNWEVLADAGNTVSIVYAKDTTDVAAKFTNSGKGFTATEYGRKSGNGDTWETIFGIPAGSKITAVQCTAWKYKRVSVTKLTSQNITINLIDDTPSTLATVINNVSLGNVQDSSYQTGAAGTNQTGLNIPSGNNVRLSLELTMVVAGTSGSATVDTRFDDVEITVTYVENLNKSTYDDAKASESVSPLHKNWAANLSDNATGAEFLDKSISGGGVPEPLAKSIENDFAYASEGLGILWYTNDGKVQWESGAAWMEDATWMGFVAAFPHDDVSISEDVATQLSEVGGPLNKSVYDNAKVSEQVTRWSLQRLEVYDNVGVSEQVTRWSLHRLTVDDDVQVSESLSPKVSSKVSIYDNARASEVLTLWSRIRLTLFDNAHASEQLTLRSSSWVSIHDDVQTSELVEKILKQLLLSKYDTAQASESVNGEFTSAELLSKNTYDEVRGSEYLTRNLKLMPSIHDDAQVSEQLKLTSLNRVSIHDDVNISEYQKLTSLGRTSVHDDVSVSETLLKNLKQLLGDVHDDLSVTELLSEMFNKWVVGVHDDVSISEELSGAWAGAGLLSANISDEYVYVRESITPFTKKLPLSIHDDVNVAESISRKIQLKASLYDNVKARESANIAWTKFYVSLYDNAYGHEFVRAWEPPTIIQWDTGIEWALGAAWYGSAGPPYSIAAVSDYVYARPKQLTVLSYDNVKTRDYAGLAAAKVASVYDLVQVSEVLSEAFSWVTEDVELEILDFVLDVVSISEWIQGYVRPPQFAYDNVKITDYIKAEEKTRLASVYDRVIVSEHIERFLHTFGTEIVDAVVVAEGHDGAFYPIRLELIDRIGIGEDITARLSMLQILLSDDTKAREYARGNVLTHINTHLQDISVIRDVAGGIIGIGHIGDVFAEIALVHSYLASMSRESFQAQVNLSRTLNVSVE